MGLIKKFKQRKAAKNQARIVRYGLILFGFNLALTLALFFVLNSLSFLGAIFNWGTLLDSFLPLVVIFLFTSATAILWYRFGQLLGAEFKKKKLLSAWIISLIAVGLLFLVLFFVLLILSGIQGTSVTLALAFLGTLFITVVAAIFELPIISLGVLTEK